MALGTLVLGYRLMQFDNGTASLPPLPLMTMMYRRLRDERRSGGVDIMFGNRAAECRGFWHTCSTYYKLGIEHYHSGVHS